ncbi:DUF4829 domain-containing protein [Romboutsia maritimum]|uniref:DUF4829 domain-containing protein n=1 Tax=Romboutsia maritimum TaxID=2020948 RepID=A0A371IR19_9FIRM|nr:DUF4829 domain-containing protein [Romboutsia maritimum]RDY22922.1 DUF4829 domain-containing protein [Romboutsia maritimum]
MKTKKIVCILFILFIIIICFNSLKKQTSLNQNTDPKTTIENSFKFENDHDVNKLKNCYTSNLVDAVCKKDSVDNIESTKLLNLNLVTDETYYQNYINTKDNLKRDDIAIYNVNYYVKFKGLRAEPIDSGEDETYYYVIKEKDSTWKIDSIGY